MNEAATAQDTATEAPRQAVDLEAADAASDAEAVVDIRLSALSPNASANTAEGEQAGRDRVGELESLLAREQDVVAGLAADLESARSEHRLELVPTRVLRDREHRERDAIERYSNAEGRWYELTIQLQRERDRTDSYVRELERVKAALTSRQRRKLGIE